MKSVRGPMCPQCKVCDDWHKYSTFATCVNCDYEREIKKRAPAKATVQTTHGMMTPSQAREFERAKAWIFKTDSLDRPEQYEFKKLTTTTLDGGTVQVFTEVGRKGDEGTMAAIFARTRRIFLISSHGGLFNYIDGPGGKTIKVTGFFDTLNKSDMDYKHRGAGKRRARPAGVSRTPTKLAADVARLLRKK